MKMREFYGRVIETALIVSEVFQNMLRNGEIDEDFINHESESDTYAELSKIAEDIEDVLTSMDETERDLHGIEDIREWAEERIRDVYGRKKEEPESTYNIRYIEYYEGFYDVKAKTYDEAVDKLRNDIQEGNLDGPEQCYHSEFILQCVR